MSSQNDQQQQNEHFNSEKVEDPFAIEPAPSDDPFASKSAPPKLRTPQQHNTDNNNNRFLDTYEEPSRWTHFQNKVVENPFAPAFLLLTVGALTVGLHHFRKGNQLKQQQMMRLRFAAQGGVVVSLFGGALYQQWKHSRSDNNTDP